MVEPTTGTITVDGTDVSTRQRGQATPRNRLRHPERGSDAPSTGHRQRRDGAGAQGPVPSGSPQSRGRGARTRRAGPQGRHPLPGAALRRRTTTRRRGASAGRRSADSVDGRAFLGRRPRGPPRSAERNTASAKRIAQDHRFRHARHRRGVQARRPCRGVRARRRAAAVRQTRAAACESGQRVRVEIHRTRPRISVAATHRRGRATGARHRAHLRQQPGGRATSRRLGAGGQ